jgi:hypothetical protein
MTEQDRVLLAEIGKALTLQVQFPLDCRLDVDQATEWLWQVFMLVRTLEAERDSLRIALKLKDNNAQH